MSYWYVPFGIIVTVLLAGFMIINPTLTIKSAADGIDLWFRLVLPALFPFFVASELLVQFGFVRLLGWLLEPITRPFFRLPGASSFVIVMGFTSGFPVGAFLTRRLLEEKLLNIKEAERLVSFTNNASPLFILGTVAVGMFGLPEAGYILAGSHYLANLTVGFIWGRMASDSSEKSNSPGPQNQDRQASLLQVLRTCQNSHTSIGKIMGDSIRKAIASVVGVGGFIVMFSVITRMLQALGFIDLIAKFLQQAAVGLHLPYSLAYGLSIGLFEMTLGTKSITSSEASLLQQLVAVSAAMAWSGISIISQVMSIVSGTPIRLSFYLRSRLLQMLLASVFTYVAYHVILTKRLVEVFPRSLLMSPVHYNPSVGAYLFPLLAAGIVLLFACLLSGVVKYAVSRQR